MIGAVDGQVVRALAEFAGGLRRKDLFPLCDSAAEELDVSAALKRLKDDGYVDVAEGRKGNVGAVYVLTGKGAELLDARPAPAGEGSPSGDTGVIDADSVVAEKLSSVAGLLGDRADIGVDHFDIVVKSLIALRKQINPPRRPIEDKELKLQCLSKLAEWVNPDIAELLNAIADDLEAA
jgi:DNA-binding PadR family transcriptional regulator